LDRGVVAGPRDAHGFERAHRELVLDVASTRSLGFLGLVIARLKKARGPSWTGASIAGFGRVGRRIRSFRGTGRSWTRHLNPRPSVAPV
jgi:hypothetical protein